MSGELFGVLGLEHELHLRGHVGTQGGYCFLSLLVHNGGAAWLVVDPEGMADVTAADFDVAGDGLNLYLEKGGGIGKPLLVGEAGHAVGPRRTPRHLREHGAVHGIEVVLAPIALVAVGRRRRPQDIGLVHVRPAGLAQGESGHQILNGPEPLGAHVVGVLGADVAAGFHQADDVVVVVHEHNFAGAAENSTRFVANDVDFCHRCDPFR